MYIAETLWGIAHGKCIDAHFSDIVGKKEVQETRSAEEIKESIKARLRG